MSNIGGINADLLRSFVERIERIEETIREEQENRKQVYAEARGAGFDVKIMRRIVKERRLNQDDLAEETMLLELYRAALSAWNKTPLGEYSEAAE